MPSGYIAYINPDHRNVCAEARVVVRGRIEQRGTWPIESRESETRQFLHTKSKVITPSPFKLYQDRVLSQARAIQKKNRRQNSTGAKQRHEWPKHGKITLTE